MRALLRDIRGASAVEFAMTAPLFLMLLLGAVEGGLLLWTKLGIQHGVEMAARCSAVNASQCGSTADIQTYAARQSYGVSVPSEAFVFTVAACGNQVAADYAYPLISGALVRSMFGASAVRLTARSCFPK